MISPALFVSFLSMVLSFSLNDKPFVKLDQGFLIGEKIQTRKGRNISIFLGIPYARPPVGSLRFSEPVPAESWLGIRLAIKQGNICPQIKNGKFIGNEDCLQLNVYTPVINFETLKINGAKSLLPVMVYIHGGGFRTESNDYNIYGPHYFLDKDIVLVSINYRLGVLGFFNTGDSVVPGNQGLKDQVLALKWVQKNIKSFGGDPDRVTLFGNSAGASAVNLHALSESSNGLFHQYIFGSGNALSHFAFRSRNSFKPYVDELAMEVGCDSTSNSEDLVECLRAKSAHKLVCVDSIDSFNISKYVWTPTNEVESDDAFLSDSPENLLAQNKLKDYPCMIGNVLDEGLLNTINLYKSNTDYESIISALDTFLDSTANYYVGPSKSPYFRDLILQYYFDESVIEDREKLLKNFTRYASDARFFYPGVILFEKMAAIKKKPLYSYLFAFRGKESLTSIGYGIKKNIGVMHGEELMYLFFPSCLPSEKSKLIDQKIIDLMVDLWTSFAINGKPTSVQFDNTNFWQPYVQEQRYLRIGNINDNTNPSVTLEHFYFSEHINVWKKLASL